MKNKTVHKTTVTESVTQVADELGSVVAKAEKVIDTTIAPVRKSFSRRFPSIFLLIVTFGVTATFFGIEQVLIQYNLLNEYPWLILGIGIGTLIGTGTLYKKLG